jgi:hypothetical protein
VTVRRRAGRGPRSRRTVSALLVALGTLTLAACGPSGGVGSGDTLKASERAAADLQDDLTGMPGVSEPYVVYTDAIDLPAYLEVSVVMTDPAQVEPAFPEIEKAAWLSEVDPLWRMTVTVVPPTGPGISREYDLQDKPTVDDLTERWGQRP